MPALISFFKTAGKILWRIFLFYLTWAVFLAIFLIPIGKNFSAWYKTSPIQARLYGDTATLGTILIATWLALKYIDRRPLKTIGFSAGNILRNLITGLIIGSAWLLISVCIAWLSGWAYPLSTAGFSWTVLAAAALSMLFNVAAQELLLCGFIFQTIRNNSNTAISIVISAAIFAGYHAGAFHGQWLPVINVFIAGALFCIAYLVTGNLWLPIAIHFAWDVLLGPVFGITESGQSLGCGWKMFTVNGPKLFTGGSFGLEGGLIVTMTTIITMIFIYSNFKGDRIISESYNGLPKKSIY